FIANAATTATSELTQSITAGALSTDIRDESGDVVSDPAFAMDPAIVSTTMQTVDGVFGTGTQRISVDNPGGADGGWTLALNATTPGSGEWTSGSDSYPYNSSESAGRLTVDPSTGTISVVIGDSTGVSLGSSASFSG